MERQKLEAEDKEMVEENEEKKKVDKKNRGRRS